MLLPCALFNQDIPKGTNTIKVNGVTFRQVADGLLDAGYSFEKIDSNFQTIKTEFRQSKSVSTMQIALYARVKDSSLIITGKGFMPGLEGGYLLGKQLTKEDATMDIKYTSGNYKKLFNEMNAFAKSFNKPVEYLKQ